MTDGVKPLLQSRGSQARFNMGTNMENQKRKKVLVVGAGAAGEYQQFRTTQESRLLLTTIIGMSCAHHLAEHPDKFDVTLVDAVDYCGGQAYSIPLDKEKTGASWLNQGVQGGAYIFHHTMTMFARNGFWADPVKLQVSFGKDDQFWTNVFPTKMLKKHASEVKRFFYMLKIIRTFEIFFALLPIKYLVKLFWFSTEFANVVALPMVALFLGTGNYAPEVPSMVLERLCTSPTYGMWYPPDKNSIASNQPPMVVFPNFSEFYETWRKNLVKKGVKVRLSTEVTRITRRDKNGVTVKIIGRTPAKDHHNTDSAWVPDSVDNSNADAEKVETTEEYDEIVLCVLTDTAKRLLKPTITTLESKILGSAKFANDVTVTHTDADYMRKHYENFYNPDQAVSEINGVAMQERCDFAKDNFKPMYLIKMYPQDLTKLEMCFDCTNYQAQFPPSVPFDNHVFQTIFLNNERDGHLWSIDQIDESKIIRKDWWHQLCHSFTHYLFVVPWMWLLQGKRHTRYAAAWTMVNAHEVACISGISAAVDLGADYPEDLERDQFALLSFRLYYLLVYGRWYRRKATKHSKEGVGKDYASGLYGSNYQGPGVNANTDRLIWRKEVEAGRSLESF
jgi:predicted NAD/FAD-binding protein